MNPTKRLSPLDGHQYFFGYYDVPAFSADGRKHLCHRSRFRDRLPTSDDLAELGVFDLRTGEFSAFATTRAWNFQQGSMLQWLGSGQNAVTYNAVDSGNEYRGVIHDLDSHRVVTHDRPFANLSSDGRSALSINFDRMFDFRPGYGYAAKPDPWCDAKHPDDDGVWLIDLTSGRTRLVLSLASLRDRLRHLSPLIEEKLLINHITFNPSGTRFIALVRNFPVAAYVSHPAWRTTVITADLSGEDLHVLVGASYASHYHWRDDRTLVMHAEGPQGMQLYEIADELEPRFAALDPAFFLRDGHCSYSPDQRTMLYDSYPDSQGIQHLYLYDLAVRRGREIASYPALPVQIVDLRCDLHPRWRRDGKAVSFDSTHEGIRGLYLTELVD